MQSTNARTRLTRCMAVTTRLRRSPHPPRGWRIQVAVLTVIWAGLRTAWAGRAGAAWGRGTPAAPRGRGSCSQPETRGYYRYSGHMYDSHLLWLGLGLRLHGLYGGGRGRGRAVGRGGLGRGLGPVHAGVRTPVKAAQAVVGAICNQSINSNRSRYL